jgi:hypothetical protein
MENNTYNYNKEMSDLYFRLYTGCIEYKMKKDKEIQCDNFYRNFELYSKRYIKDKEVN